MPVAGAHAVAAQIASRARIRSRKCSSSTLGTRTKRSSPAAQQAGEALGVAAVGLHPVGGAFGIRPGATMRTSRPRSRPARARPKPVGPAS